MDVRLHDVGPGLNDQLGLEEFPVGGIVRGPENQPLPGLGTVNGGTDRDQGAVRTT